MCRPKAEGSVSKWTYHILGFRIQEQGIELTFLVFKKPLERSYDHQIVKQEGAIAN